MRAHTHTHTRVHVKLVNLNNIELMLSVKFLAGIMFRRDVGDVVVWGTPDKGFMGLELACVYSYLRITSLTK